MSTKLSNELQNINRYNWYYEEKYGIQLVHEVYKDGVYICTDQVTIPWRKIRASVRRYEASKKP